MARFPVELLISDKKGHRKLIRATLNCRDRKSLYTDAKDYVRQVWRGHNLEGVQEGRLFQD